MICPTLFYAVFCGSAARQHCERILLAAIETNSGIALQKARDAPRSVYCLHAFLLHRQRTLEVVRVRSSLQGPVVAKPVLDSTPLPMFIYSHPSIFMRSAVARTIRRIRYCRYSLVFGTLMCASEHVNGETEERSGERSDRQGEALYMHLCL